MEITKYPKDLDEVKRIALELSKKYGGAWVWLILPFASPGTPVVFRSYQSPCKVPDHLHDFTHNCIAYNGEMVEFTQAARIREYQRGFNADR